MTAAEMVMHDALVKIAGEPPYPMLVRERDAWRQKIAEDALAALSQQGGGK